MTLAWQRRIRSVLESHQLTHVQFVLLASLWWMADHDDQPPTQSQLANQAGTDPMMTSQVIRKLETRGLLERALDPADSRARRLGLTAAGRALVSRALADVEASDEEYFSVLGRERDTFVRALRTLEATPAPPPVT